MDAPDPRLLTIGMAQLRQQVLAAAAPLLDPAALQGQAKQGRIGGRSDGPIPENLNPANQKILGLTLQTQANGFDLGQFRHGEVVGCGGLGAESL
jgi:hypothetical protein